MPSPFPGMNPYLENPRLWSEVHSRLIVNLADAIVTDLPDRYRVAVEQRTYLDSSDAVFVGIPDVSVFAGNADRHNAATATVATTSDCVTVSLPMPEQVTERYLEIQEIATGFVVTALEILSPKNKRSGEGRTAYLGKRKQVLASQTHLVEIDLLRRGKPIPILGEIPVSDYRILVSRSNFRPQAQLYGFNLQQEIPRFSLPLKPHDLEPIVDVQAILNGAYDRARYHLAIDYRQDPVPPLSGDRKAWMDAFLRERGLR